MPGLRANVYRPNEDWFGANPRYTDEQLEAASANQTRPFYGGRRECGGMEQALADFAHDVERGLDKLGPPYSYTRTFSHRLERGGVCIPFFVRVDILDERNPARDWFESSRNSSGRAAAARAGSECRRSSCTTTKNKDEDDEVVTPRSENQEVTVPIGKRDSTEWAAAVEKGVALVKGLFEIPDRQVAFDNEGRRVEYVRERMTKLPLQELERRDERRYLLPCTRSRATCSCSRTSRTRRARSCTTRSKRSTYAKSARRSRKTTGGGETCGRSKCGERGRCK